MPADSSDSLSFPYLFPYDAVRPEQGEMVRDVYSAVSSGRHLIAHAPTGLGKTAAVLAPSLSVALKKGFTVFFLTSRHTQHSIAVETLRLIKEKHGVKFTAVDMVGKKNMCARSEVDAFLGSQFHDYCRSLRENDGCKFYLNVKKGSELTHGSKNVLNFINSQPVHTEEVVSAAKQNQICPYEISAAASKGASVIIADYYSIFNPVIREAFFKRTGKSLEKSIIVVDEAHNLPGRLRDMLTERLSDFMFFRAIGEAEKLDELSIKTFLVRLQNGMHSLLKGEECIISMEQLLQAVSSYDIPLVLEKMGVAAESIREAEHHSFIGSIADFLAGWQSTKDGFARILSVGKTGKNSSISLSYQCLDPSIEVGNVIGQAHSVILMSGTLTPMFMYRDILGFPEETVLKEYKNPFPEENRLALIIKGATTRFTERNKGQYAKIAEICAASLESIPGNVALFFPSYYLMGQVHVHLHDHISKKIFKEHQNMSKEEKQELLKGFKNEWFNGGVLLAVVGGNFSEGIDLPGNSLNGVIIVGLPLVQNDLFIKELIGYYDKRYKRGWDYGYVFPAFIKALQSAGRCIRSETDRGVVLFIDDRYAWERYYNCFPKELSPKTTVFFQKAIRDFFEKSKTMRESQQSGSSF